MSGEDEDECDFRFPRLTSEEDALLALADEWAVRDQRDFGEAPYSQSTPRLTYWAVSFCQGLVDNNGFQRLFEGDFPGNPPYSLFVDAYRRIGSDEAAGWIEDAASMFPFSSPELHCDLRNKYLDELRSKTTDGESIIGNRVIDLSHQTFQQLAQYVKNHLEEFVSE